MKQYSRGQFMRRSAVAVGGVASLGAIRPGAAFARSAATRVRFPAGSANVRPRPERSVHPRAAAVARPRDVDDHRPQRCGRRSGDPGTAHGSDGTSYDFDTDMRFMQGTYVGLDGRVRKGSFGFV